jgi:hypothetical protein
MLFLGYLLGKEDGLLNEGCHGCSRKDGVSERLVGKHQLAWADVYHNLHAQAVAKAKERSSVVANIVAMTEHAKQSEEGAIDTVESC